MKLRLSRSMVTVLLFSACVALISLIQAQDDVPNKCETDWDFCNSGTEEENAYYWQLGWCASMIEIGFVEVSPSACMNQPEGTVTFPPSTTIMVGASDEDGSINPGSNNACDDWGDICTSGTEEENAYHWQLGWCVFAVYTRATWASVSGCMGKPEGTVSHPPWSAPVALVNPSRPDAPGLSQRQIEDRPDWFGSILGAPEGMVCVQYQPVPGPEGHHYECTNWRPTYYKPKPEPTEEPGEPEAPDEP